MEDGYPRLTDEVAEKLNDGDTDYLINTMVRDSVDPETTSSSLF